MTARRHSLSSPRSRPIHDPNTDARAVTYSGQVEQVVNEMVLLSKNLPLVDMYSALSNSDILDGLHPSDSGCQKMADVCSTALSQPVTGA